MVTIYDWNIVISVHQGAYKQAKNMLRELGTVGDTPYYNVLVMWVPDVHQAMEELRARCVATPGILKWLGHFIPVTTIFHFNTAKEFEAQAKQAVQQWLPELAGKRFHVRMHRRGFKHRLEEHRVECLLGETLLARLDAAGMPGQVTFDDPDAVVVVETVGQQAGLGLLTREDLKRYPFLHVTH